MEVFANSANTMELNCRENNHPKENDDLYCKCTGTILTSDTLRN